MKQIVKTLVIGLTMVTPITILQATRILSQQDPYGYVYGFGDDLFDTGSFVQYAGKYQAASTNNNNDTLDKWESAKFLEPFYRGRSISDGRVAIQTITTNLLAFGGSSMVSHKENKWVNGTNWSTIGARIDETDLRFYGPDLNNVFTRQLADKYTFSKQVAGYKKAILNKGRRITNRDLVLINIGTNDILDIVEAGWQPEWNVKQMMFAKIEEIVRILIEQIKIIMAEKPKDIVVWNLPNLSRIPRYATTNNLKRDAASDYSDKFNQVLKTEIELLKLNSNQWQTIPKLFDFKMNFANYLNLSLREKRDYTKAAMRVDFNNGFLKGVFQPNYINGATVETLNKFAFITDIHLTGAFHTFLADEFCTFLRSSFR